MKGAVEALDISLGRAWQDSVIGLCIAVVVAKGGADILLDAWSARREQDVPGQRSRRETSNSQEKIYE